jgi:ketosteroid isomerase-like protein
MYNGGMTETSTPSQTGPAFSSAGTFLEAIAAHDFARLADALDPEATMSALLPRGFDEQQGAAAICAAFERWFGNVEHFELADASVGQIGALLQMRWRLRLCGTRFGDAPMTVEQNVFAATAPDGRIKHLSLLCSGFWPATPGWP